MRSGTQQTTLENRSLAEYNVLLLLAMENESALLQKKASDFYEHGKQLHLRNAIKAAINDNHWDPVQTKIEAAARQVAETPDETAVNNYKRTVEVGGAYIAHKIKAKLSAEEIKKIEDGNLGSAIVSAFPGDDETSIKHRQKYEDRLKFLVPHMASVEKAEAALDKKKAELELQRAAKTTSQEVRRAKVEAIRNRHKPNDESSKSTSKKPEKQREPHITVTFSPLPSEEKLSDKLLPTQSHQPVSESSASKSNSSGCWASFWSCCFPKKDNSVVEEEKQRPDSNPYKQMMN